MRVILAFGLLGLGLLVLIHCCTLPLPKHVEHVPMLLMMIGLPFASGSVCGVAVKPLPLHAAHTTSAIKTPNPTHRLALPVRSCIAGILAERILQAHSNAPTPREVRTCRAAPHQDSPEPPE